MSDDKVIGHRLQSFKHRGKTEIVSTLGIQYAQQIGTAVPNTILTIFQ